MGGLRRDVPTSLGNRYALVFFPLWEEMQVRSVHPSGSLTTIFGEHSSSSSGTKTIHIPQPAWTQSILPNSSHENFWLSA